MKVVNVKANVFEGYAVTVEIKGSIEDYAKALLSIFNNVRVSSGNLISVENNSGNDIIVNCTEKLLEATKDWLECFGEIKSVEKVLCYQMEEPCYDIDKYYNCIAVPYFD